MSIDVYQFGRATTNERADQKNFSLNDLFDFFRNGKLLQKDF